MSVDQTFHTPSFGDEEFEIPPLTYAPTAAATRCSGQGVFGNQIPVEYLKRKLSCDQISVYLPRQEENFPDCQIYNQHISKEYIKRNLNTMYLPRQEENTSYNTYPLSHLRSPESLLQPQQQQQQQQGSYLVHPSSPQGHIMNNNQFHNPPHQQQNRPQDMYQQNEMIGTHSMGMQMQYDNHQTYTGPSMQQGSLQQMQMTLMSQQQQQQQQHMQNPQQQQVFSTINQSQISNQLGLQISMANMQQQQGNSPLRSNHNSPAVESSEDSDDSTPLAQLIGAKKRLTPEPVESTTVPKPTKKPKGQKKKKKRDPNEPQKPVSAYALFFRDTQAAIKGQSPNASFGEVSKIVASMWDSLDIDRKNSYKKKTETAKKEYLKALAAYRANLVSKAAVDQSDSMYGNSVPNASPPVSNSPNSSPPGRMMSMQKQQSSPVLTSVVDSMQPVTNSMNIHSQNQQVWHMQSPQQMTNTSPPHIMHGNNGMINMHQQQMQPQMSPPQQMAVMNQQQQVPQMNMNSSPQICNSTSNSPSYNQNMSSITPGNHPNMINTDMMPPLPTCLRNGCSNPAIDSPDWDREYCSSECVVSHCKDVFATWVAQRQVNQNPYSTVK